MKKQLAELTVRAMHGRTLSILPAALFLFFSWTTAAPAAVTLDGSSRSYLYSRESLGGSDLLPGYEYLDFSAGNLGMEELSVHFGGWGRYDFEQESGDTDIQYAYLSYKGKSDNRIVNLGRVLVFEGVTAERVDGLYARTDLQGGFGISAYGGVPVETGISTPGNDLIYGARIAYRAPDRYAIGVSYLMEEKDSNTFREEEGVDLWFRPADQVEILGRSTYESEVSEWKEHYYNLILGPYDRLRFTTEFARHQYEAYIRETTTPALFFGAGVFDPNETSTLIGEEVFYTASDRLTVSANYRLYLYDLMGNASFYGGGAGYAVGAGTAAGFSVHRMDGDDNRLQYTRYRVYGAGTFGKVKAAVDLIDLEFDESRGGEDNAYSAILALAYDLSRSLRVGADAEYVTGPLFDRDVRIFAKIIYRFGWKMEGGA